MRYSAVAALMILTTVLLSGCGQDQMAQLEDRSRDYYGRDPRMKAGAVFTPSYQMTMQTPAQYDTISSAPLAAPAPAAGQAAMPFRQVAIATTQPVQPITSASMGYKWPVDGKVITKFGKQREGIANEGITIAAAKDAPIKAAADGSVAYVGSNVRDYGNLVILRHANGEMTSYAHADRIIVAKGMTVKQGDVVGYVGTSGNAKAPQLHFALRAGDKAVDPLSKLPQNVATLN